MKTRILFMGILCVVLATGIVWAGDKPTSETRTVDQVVDASRGADQQIDIQPCDYGRMLNDKQCKNRFGKYTPFKNSCDMTSWCCRSGSTCASCRAFANKPTRYTTWWERYIKCLKQRSCRNIY